MYILLISPTANTILSFILGLTCGGIAMAFWYGSHKESRRDEKEFDEADIYNQDVYNLFDNWKPPKTKRSQLKTPK